MRLAGIRFHAMVDLARVRVLVNLAELARKCQLLFTVDRLIAEKQHAMLEQQRLDVIALLESEGMAQIDPADLGADVGLELLDGEASGELGMFTVNDYSRHGGTPWRFCLLLKGN